MNVKTLAGFSLGPLCSALLGFISLPIITWFFSVEDIGRLSMFQTVASFYVMLFCLGLDQAYVREYHLQLSSVSLFRQVIVLPILLGTTFSVLILLQPTYLSFHLYEIKSKSLTYMTLAYCFVSLLNRFLSLILRMEGRAFLYSAGLILPKFLFLLGVLITISVSKNKGFAQAAWSQIFSVVSVFIFYVFLTGSHWNVKSGVNFEKLRELLNYAFPLMLSGIAFWGITASDRFFLKELSNFFELGIYSVAVSFSGAAMILQVVFGTMWAPFIYKAVKDQVKNEVIEKYIFLTACVVLLVWCCIGICAPLIRFMLPEKYCHVDKLMLLTMVYPLLYTLSEATGIGVGISKRTGYALLASVISLIFNFTFNQFLIPKVGALGAAFSSALAFLVFFIIRTEASCRVWHEISRFKIYWSVFILFCVSIVSNISSMSMWLYLEIWCVGSVIVAINFKAELKVFCFYVAKGVIKSGKI